MRMRPLTVPSRLRQQIASKLEPPPRPTAPPRPWNSCSRTPAVGDARPAGRATPCAAPSGGEVAAVLVAVRIADHHFLQAGLRPASDADQRQARDRRAMRLRRGAQVARWSRTAARRRSRPAAAAPGANRPDLLEQEIDLQQVRDALWCSRRYRRGSPAGRRAACASAAAASTCELAAGLVAIGREGRAQQPAVAEFGAAAARARRLVERRHNRRRRRPRFSSSATTRACTAEFCRRSSVARWKPKTSTAADQVGAAARARTPAPASRPGASPATVCRSAFSSSGPA